MSEAIKKKRLRDLLSFVVDNRGRTCPTADKGLPLIATNCVKNSTLFPVFDKVRYVSDETYQNWFRAHPQPGDLIFVLKGTPGRVCLTPNPVNFCIAQDMVGLRTDENEVDPLYLFAALRSPQIQDAIANLHVGSMIAHFKKGDFDRLEIPLPDRRSQAEIGELYLLLSQKIEHNTNTAATLEAMARSLYKSWFVDFDPVHSRIQGVDPSHMNEATAALFPDHFGDDGLPDGWLFTPVGKHFKATKGLSYKGTGLCQEGSGVPLHNLNSVLEGGGYKHGGIKYYSGDFKPRHEVKPGDLVVANTEQGFDHLLIGHAALIPQGFGPIGLFSHHLYKVDPRPGSHLSRVWLYLALSITPLGTIIRSYSNGTTVNMLPADAFDLPMMIVPPKELVERFNEIVEPWFEKRDATIAQSQTLADLRDTLLPRLMSGELRIGDAREQVEEML